MTLRDLLCPKEDSLSPTRTCRLGTSAREPYFCSHSFLTRRRIRAQTLFLFTFFSYEKTNPPHEWTIPRGSSGKLFFVSRKGPFTINVRADIFSRVEGGLEILKKRSNISIQKSKCRTDINLWMNPNPAQGSVTTPHITRNKTRCLLGSTVAWICNILQN